MKTLDAPVLSTVLPLRLLSFNIRYANTNPVKGEEPWSTRLPHLATTLRFLTSQNPNSFICHQEVLSNQLQDLARELGPDWAHIGIGRDGGDKGEFSPIFYRKEVWNCEECRTAWLSPTPEKPSRGWDAVLNRIVTMGLFSHRATGARVVVMSTHFDHVGVKARAESAKLILKFVDEWREKKGQDKPLAVMLGGDFNSTPEDEGYKTMTAAKTGMLDTRDLIDTDRRYGNDLTFTGFGDEKHKRIDFLFLKSDLGVDVTEYGVPSNRFDDGIYISDHRPVVADMEIPMCKW